MRCFMIIEEGLGKTVNEMDSETIVKDHPSLAIDMKLPDDLLKVYIKLLGEGFEEMQHICLMVVGMNEVGKTTLVRKLCGKCFDDDGIDILQHSCEIKEDFDWEVSDPKTKEKYLTLRSQELTKYRKQDKKSDTSTVTCSQIPEPTTTTKMLNEQRPGNKTVEELKKNATKEDEPLKRRPTVSIWDFAGQPVYYSTHHFFLNARSIYILVLNLSKSLHEKAEKDNQNDVHQNKTLGNITKGYTCLDTFKFWMKSIYIYTKQKKASLPDNQKKEYTPRIILVGTFKDKISDEMLNGRTLTAYKEDYFKKALHFFKGTSIFDLVHEKSFLISNTDSDENDFLSIKKEIYNISTEMPFWNEKVPAKFIPLEKAILQQKKKERHTMKFSELKEVSLNVEYPYTEAEIKLFLAFQHTYGNVVYYNMGTHTDQDDGRDLSELIILKPQWIINAFKALVMHKDTTIEIRKADSWRKFENCGHLQKDLVDPLLQQHNYLKEKDNILRYLEYLQVIAKPVVLRTEIDKAPSSKSETKHYFLDGTTRTETKEGDFYVMPCMLPPMPRKDMLKELYKAPNKDTHYTTLCMYSKKGFLSAFVFHRILATAIKEFPIAISNSTQLLFNGLGSFDLTKNRMLSVWCTDSIIHLRVTFKGACEDEKEEIECCIALRMRFEKLVLEVFNFHGRNTYDEANQAELFSVHVFCPGCKEQDPFVLSCIHNVESLLDVKEKDCGCCNKRITSRWALKYWYAEPQNGVFQMKVKCRHLVDLAEEITVNELQMLSQELGISDIARVKIEEEIPKDRVVYSVLYRWSTRGDGLKFLYDSMNNVGLNTGNFDSIILGEVNKKDEKKINEYMEVIKKGENDILKLSCRQIAQLSECFGNEYWFFGIRLGIHQKRLERLVIECRGIQKEMIQILSFCVKEKKPFRKFIKAVVLSKCDWNLIRPILINETE